MSRSPFELSFDDLIAAGADATMAAIEQAERAGVPIAVLELPAKTKRGVVAARRAPVEPRRRRGA
jgi:ribosomal protein S12 methylthiotransferase accessory factor YcaO